MGDVAPWAYLDFYPRSPCGERLVVTVVFYRRPISIHALLAESDVITLTLNLALGKFLSTLSLRRATAWKEMSGRCCPDFYPRSPCGERLPPGRAWGRVCRFLSTLSLRRATRSLYAALARLPFLSTLSLRRATAIGRRGRAARGNFYPRSPCGERPAAPLARRGHWPFLSTLSLRRATLPSWDLYQMLRISIHALLAESDRAATPVSAPPLQFLSTLSLRRATLSYYFRKYLFLISIHALLAESDLLLCLSFFWKSIISIHALLAESDIAWIKVCIDNADFYPRSPCGERQTSSR